jgi:NTE family protein
MREKMATKNSSFTAFTIANCALICLLLTSCTTFRYTPKKRKIPEQQQPTGQTETQQESQPEIESAIQTLPRVGIVLGPGGLLSYAHIGVLKSLEKARIQVHSISGLEWGSLVAALYARKGKLGDTEWQMFKLKKSNLPSTGLLNGKVEPESINKIDPFLRKAFQKQKMQSSAIGFSCPTKNIRTKDVRWRKTGYYTNALAFCMTYPPLFDVYKNWAAEPFAIEDAMQKLREDGAELIIYIDVLPQKSFVRKGRFDSSSATRLLWDAIQRTSQKAHSLADEIIEVNLGGYTVDDFSGRRKMVIEGQKAGVFAAEKLSKKYGF